MSPEDMLISLCINSCRKRYFRLKALCDIAETINTCCNLDWSKFITKTTAYDCRAIVYTALRVTQITLGCEIPGDLFDKLKVDPIKLELIHYLSHRLSLSAFASLYSGKNFLGRHINYSLVLPYVTFRGYQVWRRILFASLFTENGMPRLGFWPSIRPRKLLHSL